MNLIGGELMERAQAVRVLNSLPKMIADTLNKGSLPLSTVVDACDRLGDRLNEKQHLPLLLEMGVLIDRAKEQLMQTKRMLSKDYLLTWLAREFGPDFEKTEHFVPLYQAEGVWERWAPLGVLLHIAAGNAQGLPVFSVIEGLLTGNINILKLPGVDDGISILLLHELIGLEPALSGYIHVFDIPSEDLSSMQKMAEVADAIVVWGGDAAVSAVRQMSKPNTRLIEWGHKISFAYATMDGISDESLRGLAEHICDTEQLLCNSCQGIFLDTSDYGEVQALSRRFATILADVSARCGDRNLEPALSAQITLNRRTEELGTLLGGAEMTVEGDCSVTAYDDRTLSPSLMFRNCWVKPLPKGEIVSALKPYKNHLQTAALLCGESEREGIENALIKAGVVRITCGKRMAQTYCGMPHDGEYALRRYMKRIVVERG